ncbi:erbin-like [Lingula anatina]|uniref:Erbin-like n=1 Tax=Lingula anatina TaxID=7574 RepID=A0A1S3HGY1_LINAN|nr:erbin-like [Lingula anatina]|eukprot:XP_013384746.1 erbin-like [Lingula anatina]
MCSKMDDVEQNKLSTETIESSVSNDSDESAVANVNVDQHFFSCVHEYQFQRDVREDEPSSPPIEEDGRANPDHLTELYISSDLPEDHVNQIIQEKNYEKIWDLLVKMLELRTLSLSFLQLPCIPNLHGEKCVFTEKLRCLFLTGNNLEDLPDAMRVLQCLKRMQLGSNSFTKIPDVIARLQGLEHLDMSKNQVTDDGIAHLDFKDLKLKELYLNGNKIRTLPPNIFKLRELTHFDGSYNELQSIPDEIDQLQNLKYIRLKQNRLRRLPESLGNVKSLEVICVSENCLQDIPAEKLAKLPKLRLCCLHSNRLGQAVFQTLKKAKFHVRFGDNRLVDPKIAKDKIEAGCHMTDVPSGKMPIYDVFILYSGSEEDEKLINDVFLPGLEEENELKVCVAFRDYIPGQYVSEEAISNMKKSRKIIALLTEHFDEQAKAVEINQAVGADQGRQSCSVIPVVSGNPDYIKIPAQFEKIVPLRAPVDWDKLLTAIKA